MPDLLNRVATTLRMIVEAFILTNVLLEAVRARKADQGSPETYIHRVLEVAYWVENRTQRVGIGVERRFDKEEEEQRLGIR